LATMTETLAWNRSANPYLEDIQVLKEGEKSGYGIVARFALQSGRQVFVISLPHDYRSRTGPTWAYLTNSQGWTLIDAGSHGALDTLKDGLSTLGLGLTDLKRVIITHGHQDHDGNVYDLLKASGAELWAHEMYFHFLPYSYHHGSFSEASPLHRVINESREREEAFYQSKSSPEDSERFHSQIQGYMQRRQSILEEKLPIHPLRDGEELDGMQFLYTPGHAVDEISISLDGVVFTGDHILPQISPHPTYKQAYPEALVDIIPEEYRDSGECYGLESYLKSLGKVLSLDYHTTVFPAHRLFTHGRFHIRNLRRAQDIVRHHVRRLERIMGIMGEGADTVAKVTEKLFPPRKLSGGGFFAAVPEVVSHLELLVDTGDVLVGEDGRVRSSGTDNFYSAIEAMTSYSTARDTS
jgi:glyoxylase-like metal-dependent hydrolase (beta-lactamase superfamily II)